MIRLLISPVLDALENEQSLSLVEDWNSKIFLWFTRNSQAAGSPQSLISSCGLDYNQRARWFSVTSPWTPRALSMTGVISVLPVNHRVGGSLENLILKISSRVNDCRCLWDKLLSLMIRYRLNVTKE